MFLTLQSDLSNLSGECQRMINNGADWLHMGTLEEDWERLC
jgi:pentose-5-phosphate-3-epimerase